MIDTGAISYAVGGSAFLVLSVLLATSWRGRLQGGAIVAATTLTTVWSFWLGYRASMPDLDWAATLLPELLRDGAWLGLLLTLLRGHGPKWVISRAVVYAIFALWLGALTYSAAVTLGVRADLSVQIVAALAIALVGLILVEQVYRNTRPEKRWGIKFLVLAVGAMFGYDLFLYSQALLLHEIDADLWSARGLVNGLTVPMIAVAAARNPDWSVNVFVSRQVVFYTTALMGAGIYLLAMAAGGYYIRLHGGTWGTFAQAVFLGGAALMLVVIMLSSDLRAKARVFLVKHFYKNRYDYRIEWLRLITTLATPVEDAPLPERAAQALAQLVESPGAGLWLQQESGEFLPVARWGPAPPDGAIEASGSALVLFLQERQWVIDLVHWRTAPGHYDNLRLPDWLSSQDRAWLLVPLMQGAQVVGFVVLTRAQSSTPLTWEDTDLLKTVGRQIASYLAQHQAAQALAEARQFDAFHRLTAFIMHDLKNLIAQQSLVVQNAARHKHNPAFIEDVIRTIDNSVTRMNQLLEQLRRGDAQSRPRRVALREVLAESIARQGSMQPVPELQVLEDEIDVLADPQVLTAVLGHVVRNAQEATSPNGHVQVRLLREGSSAVVEVEDTGTGMDPLFVRERLFRPFDSTKGSKGMGIGAYQVREFVRAAGGDVQVGSAIGKGTTFRILLPALVRGPGSQLLARVEHQK